VPAIVTALTRLRGFAQLEIAPPVIRRGKSGHFCDKALEAFRTMPSSPMSTFWTTWKPGWRV